MQTFDAEFFPLSFCPTGMVPRRHDSPFVPLKAAEIIEQTKDAYGQGATSVHLHARDEHEKPAWEKSFYREIITTLRAECPGLVICVTTSGREEQDPLRRADVLDLEGDAAPDMASLTLSSLNFSSGASLNSPETVQQLAKRMLERGIKPELEIFDLGMMNYTHYLIRKGLLHPPYVVNFILGGPATAQADPLSLGALLSAVPRDSVWLAGGIGLAQTTSAALALASGGGVRVGLEDNLYWDNSRSRLATNGELVRRVVGLAELIGKKPMPGAVFRESYLARG